MHIESISNGFGAPSMYMMVLAGMKRIPATVSISADTGWEEDNLLSDGRKLTAGEFYSQVVEPLGVEMGIKTAFIRTLDGNGKPLPSLKEKLIATNGACGVPLFGDRGGRLSQGCTGKWKIAAIRQELRRMGATSARSALGITMDELQRMKQTTDVKWEQVYWPLIDARLYKKTITDVLNSMNIPYMVSSECDGCPHKNLTRWQRTSGDVLDELAGLEEKFGGLFFTSRRIPIHMAIEEMKNENPENNIFDPPCSGVCFT